MFVFKSLKGETPLVCSIPGPRGAGREAQKVHAAQAIVDHELQHVWDVRLVWLRRDNRLLIRMLSPGKAHVAAGFMPPWTTRVCSSALSKGVVAEVKSKGVGGEYGRRH